MTSGASSVRINMDIMDLVQRMLCGPDGSPLQQDHVACPVARTSDGNAHRITTSYSGFCHGRPIRNHRHTLVRVAPAAKPFVPNFHLHNRGMRVGRHVSYELEWLPR